MSDETIKKIVRRSREDDDFFHALVFNPEKVLAELDLSREEKSRLLALDPERLIGVLVGGGSLADCGVTNTCTYTCQITNQARMPGEIVSQ